MPENTGEHRWPVAWALALAAGGVGLAFWWQGRDGFNLWDEGFLWYGVQRVMAGEVPLRDFQAYDPSRYCWSAAWLNLFGDSLVTLRASVAVFQVFGVTAGLMVLGRLRGLRHPLAWLAIAATLLVWMFPRHKLFDASLALGLIASLVFLFERPTWRRHFVAGLVVGVTATFGRNHGVYGAFGGVVVMAYLAADGWREEAKRALGWVAGIGVGYVPVLLLFAKPGFPAAFLASIRFHFELKATNMPLPVPWPWRAPLAQLPAFYVWRDLLLGLGFVAALALAVAGPLWLFWRRSRKKPVSPEILASIALAPGYAHYAFSRADLGHLALSIFPLLVGSLAWIAGRSWPWRVVLTLGLLAASLILMGPLHPGYQRRAASDWVPVEFGGPAVWMPPAPASEVALLQRLSAEFAPGGRSFVVAPFWPGAYAVLRRKCPTWEIYTVFHRTDRFQQVEIDRIRTADPGFILIMDHPLDNREELRFRNTHPLMDRYFRENYRLLPRYTDNPVLEVFAGPPKPAGPGD